MRSGGGEGGSERLDFSRGKGRAKGFGAEVRASPPTCKVTERARQFGRGLGGRGQSHIKTLFPLFSCLRPHPFCFFGLYHPSKRSLLPQCRVSSSRLSHNPSGCGVFAVGLITGQNPARRPHPAFAANKGRRASVTICICRVLAAVMLTPFLRVAAHFIFH